MTFTKSITESQMLTLLKKEGSLRFPPLQITNVEQKVTVKGVKLDALLTLRWRNKTYRFGTEICRLWTPKSISEAMATVSGNPVLKGIYPLIVAPYLNEDQIKSLEAKCISGFDLSGNGLVVVPNELFILRTGFPNRFRWEGAIKNVYRKNSSIVARSFLLAPEYASVKEVLKQIGARGGKLTLATVSKVCTKLEGDLIVEGGCGRPPWPSAPAPRRPGGLPQPPVVRPSPLLQWYRLLQPEKLLDRLADNYVPPTVTRTFRGKCGLPPEELRMRLAAGDEENNAGVVLTGESSVEAYAVMARDSVQYFYCTDIGRILASLGGEVRESDRFANVVFQETRENFPYFDRRPGLWASPIQSYLELLAGDKRDRETAEQVRKVILAQLAQKSRKEV